MRKLLWALSIAGSGYGLLSILLVFADEGAAQNTEQLLQNIAWLLLSLACAVCPFLLATSIDNFRRGDGQ
jgi:hypothetical protein